MVVLEYRIYLLLVIVEMHLLVTTVSLWNRWTGSSDKQKIRKTKTLTILLAQLLFRLQIHNIFLFGGFNPFEKC